MAPEMVEEEVVETEARLEEDSSEGAGAEVVDDVVLDGGGATEEELELVEGRPMERVDEDGGESWPDPPGTEAEVEIGG